MKTQSVFFFILVGLVLLFSAGQPFAQSPANVDSIDDPTSYYATSTKENESFFDSSKIEPGSTIKIHLAANPWNDDRYYGYLEGRFQSLEAGVLYMSVDGSTVGTQADDIYQLKVKTGSGGGAWSGAILGLLAGGLLAAAAQPDRSGSGLSGLDHIDDDIAQGTGIVLLGVVIGASIGGSMDKGKWKNVNLNHRSFGQMGQTGSDYRVALPVVFQRGLQYV